MSGTTTTTETPGLLGLVVGGETKTTTISAKEDRELNKKPPPPPPERNLVAEIFGWIFWSLYVLVTSFITFHYLKQRSLYPNSGGYSFFLFLMAIAICAYSSFFRFVVLLIYIIVSAIYGPVNVSTSVSTFIDPVGLESGTIKFGTTKA